MIPIRRTIPNITNKSLIFCPKTNKETPQTKQINIRKKIPNVQDTKKENKWIQINIESYRFVDTWRYDSYGENDNSVNRWDY